MPPFFDERGDPSLSPYTVLSLPTTATETEIKKAYRTAMLQLHPDKLSPDLSEAEIREVTEKFHNVKDAYEFLTGAQYLTARRLYMARLASERAEYERREAFLRRNKNTAVNGGTNGPAGGMNTTNASTAERTTRTRMNPPASRYPTRKSHAMNTRKPRTSRNHRGYTSDNSNRPHPKSSRNSNNGGSNQDGTKKREVRTRARSEPRRRKEDDKRKNTQSNNNLNASSNNNAKARDRSRKRSSTRRTSSVERKRTSSKKRQRAKSAPARCRGGKSTNSNNGNNTNSQNNTNKYPREFICPLTKKLLRDPVLDPDGNAYEREAIERWLRVQSSSPITNGYLDISMLRGGGELKRRIYKVVGKPRSKSQSRPRSKTRSSSPNNNAYISGRVLVDSYLREISSKSKLSVALDGMGICAFSYRRITFVIEVPIIPSSGFMVYSSFTTPPSLSPSTLPPKISAWNTWLASIKSKSRVSHLQAGHKTVFSLKGAENDLIRCDVFQKTLEYFVEMSLKLHNLLFPEERRDVENVSLTIRPVVAV